MAKEESTFYNLVLVVPCSYLLIVVIFGSVQEYPFEEAADGQQAVDIFQEKPYGYFECVNLLDLAFSQVTYRSSLFVSVILVDMSMPVLDGPGAVEAIRAMEAKRQGQADRLETSGLLPPEKRAKVFALSGLASDADKARAFNAGVDG